MIDILLLVICIVIAVRTMGYGIWTLSEKNICGGVFVLILSVSLTVLSSYLMFFDKT